MSAQVVVEIPTDLQDELQAAIERTGRSRDELIQDALRRYFAHDEQGLPRFFGIVETANVEAAEVDEWLEKNWRPE